MKFIHNIQRRLLLNHPILWSSRAVPTLIISGAVNLFLFILFYLFYTATSPYYISDSIFIWSSFLILCSIISIIIYLIFLLRFNHFKQFGILKWTDFSYQFLLYLITLGSIIAWPFMPLLGSHFAVSIRFDESDMEADVREAYFLANQIEYTKSTAPYKMVDIRIGYSSEQTDNINHIVLVESESEIEKNIYERLEKTSDSTFVGYERVNLTCSGNVYGVWNISDFSDELYESLPEHKVDIEQKKQRLNEIFDKYISNYNGSIYTAEDEDQAYIYNNEYETSACARYKLYDLNNSVNNISYSMISESDSREISRVWFYFSLFASILLIIFRYMTPRTFLWTILFTFLLFVFTVIMAAVGGVREGGILSLMLFYYIVFFGVSISIFFSKSRNVFQGIALNLSYFCLFLVPLVCVAVYFKSHYDYYDMYYWDYASRGFAYLWAEIIGVSLVVISSLFFHSRLFYKWYSLPEE